MTDRLYKQYPSSSAPRHNTYIVPYRTVQLAMLLGSLFSLSFFLLGGVLGIITVGRINNNITYTHKSRFTSELRTHYSDLFSNTRTHTWQK